jgi:hypothetical protein
MNKIGRGTFPGKFLSLLRYSIWPLSILLTFGPACVSGHQPTRSAEYEALQKRLGSGWNTWDVHSVTSHVLLPEGLAIRVGLYRKTTLNGDAFLADALIGRQNASEEQVFPGPHAWDGSYTQGLNMRVQSAHVGEDLVMLVTPVSEKRDRINATAIFSAGKKPRPTLKNRGRGTRCDPVRRQTFSVACGGLR